MDQLAESDQLLVLLTGPVGAGKSTCAEALADAMRRTGRSAGIIDMDLVYCMARQSDGFGDEDVWRTTRRGSAALANRFFEDGLSVVIVEGSFHNTQECADVRGNVSQEVDFVLVALAVSYDETARRVEADPAIDRVASRDPQVLKWLHQQFANALPFLEGSGHVVHADLLTPSEVAAAISDRLPS